MKPALVKTNGLKITVACMAVAAGLSGTVGTAAAATLNLDLGVWQTVYDPAGSGRSAGFQLVAGTESMSYSDGLYDGEDVNTAGGFVTALNVSGVAITPVAPASTAITIKEHDWGNVRVAADVNAPVTSVSLDDVSGDMRVLGTRGGVLLNGSFIGGTLTGGHASVTNLRFDLVGKTVTADLHGVRDAVGTRSAVTYDLPDTVLWTFDDVTGPTQLKPEYLLAPDPVAALRGAGFQVLGDDLFAAENVISGMRITVAGFSFLKSSLGLATTGTGALSAVNNDLQDPETGAYIGVGGYGTVTSRLVFTTAVPEPSTHALMGLGLVGLVLVVRRQAAAKPQ